MAVLKTRTADGLEVRFLAKRNGLLLESQASNVFNIVVVDPDDSASTSPTVTESTQLPGMYKFTIPSSFFTTNGTGHYVICIGIHSISPKVDDDILISLEVNEFDFDDIGPNAALVPAIL